ncbi:hypothetical protein VPH35_134027 [Triticum aestivum]
MWLRMLQPQPLCWNVGDDVTQREMLDPTMVRAATTSFFATHARPVLQPLFFLLAPAVIFAGTSEGFCCILHLFLLETSLHFFLLPSALCFCWNRHITLLEVAYYFATIDPGVFPY